MTDRERVVILVKRQAWKIDDDSYYWQIDSGMMVMKQTNWWQQRWQQATDKENWVMTSGVTDDRERNQWLTTER